MTIQWEAFDLQEEFSLQTAACLWSEFEPVEAEDKMKLLVQHNPDINRVYVALKNYFDDYFRFCLFSVDSNKYRHSGSVRRNQLVDYANSMRQKPKFLFPEARNTVITASEPEASEQANSTRKNDDSDKPLHKAALNSHLILISALLEELNIDANDRESTERVRIILQRNEESLDPKTIRNILKSLKTIPKRKKRE